MSCGGDGVDGATVIEEEVRECVEGICGPTDSEDAF